MQPSSHQQMSGHPGYGPDGAPVRPPRTGPEPGAVIVLTRARPWRVAAAALLTLLVLVAALSNQWVADRITADATDGRSFLDNLGHALITYAWRTAPPAHDQTHLWAASWAFLGTALLLTLLLVAAVARGDGGFGQAFLGSWSAVVAATTVACLVRALVADSAASGGTRPGDPNAVFVAPLTVRPTDLVGALGYGFLVALVAGLTAVLSRRRQLFRAPPAVTAPVEEAAPWPDRPPAPEPAPAWEAEGRRPDDTAVLPPVGPRRGAGPDRWVGPDDDRPTGRWPAPERGGGEPTERRPAPERDAGEPTERRPAPERDDDGPPERRG